MRLPCAAIIQDITAQFILTGTLPPLARFFGIDWEEQIGFAAELDDGGREEAVAARFLYLSKCERVEFRHREGEFLWIGAVPRGCWR